MTDFTKERIKHKATLINEEIVQIQQAIVDGNTNQVSQRTHWITSLIEQERNRLVDEKGSDQFYYFPMLDEIEAGLEKITCSKDRCEQVELCDDIGSRVDYWIFSLDEAE